MIEFEPDNFNPESDYFEASEEHQRESMERLWKMVVKYSERPESSPDERFRMGNLRHRVALLARVIGMMDRATFNAEMGRHTGMIAAAMGCRVYGVIETDGTHH